MINRNYPPVKTKGIYAGMNPEFGNYIPGAIAANSRVTYPGVAQINTQGEDAWMAFPARVMTQAATSNPALTSTGSNLDAAYSNLSLAQAAGLDGNIATGDPQGVGYMASGI